MSIDFCSIKYFYYWSCFGNFIDSEKTKKRRQFLLIVQQLDFIIIVARFVSGKISGGVYNRATGIGSILANVIIQNGNPYRILWYYLVGPITEAVLGSNIQKNTTN